MTRDLNEALPDWRPPPHPPRVTLEGRYCRVEPLDPDRHAVDLHAANLVDDAIWDWLPYGPFGEIAEYRAWMDAEALGEDPHFHAVIDRETGRALGVASYLRIAPAAGSIEVGHINYAKPLQRTRMGTEAMFLLMKQAFALGYRRYEWKCNALNQPSRNLAMRLGMSYEGVFRQAGVVKGRNRDTAWYAAIDREWPRLEAAFDAWLNPANFDDAGRQKTSLSTLTRPILVAEG